MASVIERRTPPSAGLQGSRLMYPAMPHTGQNSPLNTLEEGSSAVPTRSPSPPLNSQPDTERGKLRKSKDPEHDRQSDSEAHQRSVPVQFLGVLRHTVFLVGEPAVVGEVDHQKRARKDELHVIFHQDHPDEKHEAGCIG